MKRIHIIFSLLFILVLLSSCSSSNSVTIIPEQEIYSLDTEEIQCTLKNNFDNKAIIPSYYSIEKENNGKWEKVPLEIAVYGTGEYVLPKQEIQETYIVANEKYPLETAKYRVKVTVYNADYRIATIPDDDTQYVIEDDKSRQEETVYAEFRVE